MNLRSVLCRGVMWLFGFLPIKKNKIVFRIIDNTILKSLYDIKKESTNIIKELDKFKSNDCNMNDFTNRIAYFWFLWGISHKFSLHQSVFS